MHSFNDRVSSANVSNTVLGESEYKPTWLHKQHHILFSGPKPRNWIVRCFLLTNPYVSSCTRQKRKTRVGYLCMLFNDIHTFSFSWFFRNTKCRLQSYDVAVYSIFQQYIYSLTVFKLKRECCTFSGFVIWQRHIYWSNSPTNNDAWTACIKYAKKEKTDNPGQFHVYLMAWVCDLTENVMDLGQGP